MGADAQSRTLIIAGSVLALDIVLSNNVVQSTTLAFPEASALVNKHVDKAGKILRDDLQLRPGQSPLTKRLDRFAANLERLALLDRLSVLPALNLYEAMAGIYESLERLHDWELERLRQEPATLAGSTESKLSDRVLRKRSGRPAMHARDRVGLSLDYWKERGVHSDFGRLDKDTEGTPHRVWALMLSCAPLHGLSVSPAKVSANWIGPGVEKTNLTAEEAILNTQPVMDWLEPDDTLITPAETTAELEPGVVAKLPEVMFVATFDPPVVVPLNVWENMHNILSLAPTAEFSFLTFDNILFPVPPGTHRDPSEPRTITTTNTVTYPGHDEERTTVTYKSTLFIYKPVYGRTLTEMPFSHPRQLVAMLPALRQYAFLTTLLRSTFNGETETSADAQHGVAPERSAATKPQDEFDAIMDDAQDGTLGNRKPDSIDVTLTAHPMPRLQIVFPFRTGVANVLLEIRENAEVHVVSENITGGELDATDGKSKEKERRRNPEVLAHLLEACEDISTWCAWVQNRW
jgi:hypothetical protein